MPVNFFEVNCQTVTVEARFGLCDDPPPPNKPAYVDGLNPTKWIAEVRNPNTETVTFTAIDSCIELRRPDGSQESRCDGMLTYKNAIIFVELKERQSKGWLLKADSQLRNTIFHFANNHALNRYTSKTAFVSNSLEPDMKSFKAVRKERFKDDTGFILKIQTDITI